MDNYVWHSENAYIFLEMLYEVDKYYTFCIKIKNFEFTGERNFCINQIELEKFLKQLEKIYNEMSGCVEFRDIESDSFLAFEFKGDQVKVNGQLGGSWEENYLVFSFFVDQTILKRMMEIFVEFV